MPTQLFRSEGSPENKLTSCHKGSPSHIPSRRGNLAQWTHGLIVAFRTGTRHRHGRSRCLVHTDFVDDTVPANGEQARDEDVDFPTDGREFLGKGADLMREFGEARDADSF